METMFRVVNVTTNNKIKEVISSNPNKIRELFWEFETTKKLIKLGYPSYKDNTSRCFEYKKGEDTIIVYTMDFI